MPNDDGCGETRSALPEALARAALQAVPVGGSVLELLDYLRDRARDRGVEAVDVIVAACSRELLTQRVAQDDEFAAHFMNAIEAAMRTGFAPKRRLLAGVVTATVLDDATVDETGLIVAALRDLDAPHLRALERMDRAERAARHDGADDHRVARAVSTTAHCEPAAVVAALRQHAAVVSVSPSPLLMSADTLGVTPSVVGVSAFGRKILMYLREAPQPEF